jgi:hypothetical protein
LYSESNVINNTQGIEDGGIVYISGEVYFIQCCFMRNNNYGKGKYLIFTTNGNTKIVNCTIENYTKSGKIVDESVNSNPKILICPMFIKPKCTYPKSNTCLKSIIVVNFVFTPSL